MSAAADATECRVHVDLTRDMKRRLKLLAAARDMNIMALLRSLIEKELAGYEGLTLAAEAAKATAAKIAAGRKRQ